MIVLSDPYNTDLDTEGMPRFTLAPPCCSTLVPVAHRESDFSTYPVIGFETPTACRRITLELLVAPTNARLIEYVGNEERNALVHLGAPFPSQSTTTSSTARADADHAGAPNPMPDWTHDWLDFVH